MLLSDILSEEYALCMSSGFFRFYAHMGVLHALEENNCLRVRSCSGSSAGALVTAFLASGMKPTDMPERVFSIKRENMWDVGIGLGLLKGQLFQKILEKQFPVQTFEECPIPLGVTAYDVLGFKTNCITTGNLATAVRASCTFPGLFQPVLINNRLHIDGGVWDDGGLMALPSLPASNLIVNVVCGRGRINSSTLPERFKDARLLTLVLENIPTVSPFSMETDGPKAFSIARAATFRMLHNGHLQQLSHHHWCAYIDGSSVDLSEPLAPLPRRAHSLSSMHLTEEGEELRGLRQPVPRHHSFLFHEKSRDSIDRGSDSNIQISATISSSRSSNSSSSSGGGSSSSSSLRVNQPSLIRVDVENGNPSTLKRVGRKGQKKESSTSSSDEVLCDFPTLTEDIGRRTSHSKPKKEPSELKEEATKKRPLLSVPYADTVPSVARKVRNTEKQPVRSESKKRPLREESISLSPKAVKRIRSAPVRLSD